MGFLCFLDLDKQGTIAYDAYKRADHTCISINNIVYIKRDNKLMTIKVSELIIGDLIQSINENKDTEWDSIYYIRYHEPRTPTPMINLHLTNGCNVILTDLHFLYKQGTLSKASDIKVGDCLLNDIYVSTITYSEDIPVTVCTTNGNLIRHDIVVSCWSNTIENVNYINEQSVSFMKKVTKEYPIEKWEEIARTTYEQYKHSDKYKELNKDIL